MLWSANRWLDALTNRASIFLQAQPARSAFSGPNTDVKPGPQNLLRPLATIPVPAAAERNTKDAAVPELRTQHTPRPDSRNLHGSPEPLILIRVPFHVRSQPFSLRTESHCARSDRSSHTREEFPDLFCNPADRDFPSPTKMRIFHLSGFVIRRQPLATGAPADHCRKG